MSTIDYLTYLNKVKSYYLSKYNDEIKEINLIDENEDYFIFEIKGENREKNIKIKIRKKND